MCAVCNEEFTPRRLTQRTCSPRCRNADTSRRTAEIRGDKLRGTGNGYVKRNGRHEHRVVAEAELSRPLRPDEVVHHLDGDQSNNDPANLAVMTQSEHAALHAAQRWPGPRLCHCGKRILARGLCRSHYYRAPRAAARTGGEPMPVPDGT
jgi:hypothetical protein